jgi:hypothetical protein
MEAEYCGGVIDGLGIVGAQGGRLACSFGVIPVQPP